MYLSFISLSGDFILALGAWHALGKYELASLPWCGRKQLMNSMGFDDQNLASVLAGVAAAAGGTQWSLTWESGSVDGLGRM